MENRQLNSGIKRMYYTPSEIISFYKENISLIETKTIALHALQYRYSQENIEFICSVLNIFLDIKDGEKGYLRLKGVMYWVYKYKKDHKEYKDIFIPKTHSKTLGKDIICFDHTDIKKTDYDLTKEMLEIDSLGKDISQERLDAANLHWRLLHCKKEYPLDKGFVIFGTYDKADSFVQYSVKKDKLDEVELRRILSIPNRYMGLNTSKNITRKEQDIFSINALFLDIDNVDPEEYASRPDVIARRNLIKPTLIIKTGRGVQEIAVIQNCGNSSAMRWAHSKLQEALFELCPESDNVGDISRFCRLAGSEYSKNGVETIIELLEVNEDVSYTVNELFEILKPDVKVKGVAEEAKKQKYGKPKTDGVATIYRTSDGRIIHVYPNLERARIHDIEHLVSIGHIGEDFRKMAIHHYAVALARLTNNLTHTQEKAYELNNSFKNPLSASQMRTALHSTLEGQHYLGYVYKSKRLMEELGLEDQVDILKQLKTITTVDIKKINKNKAKSEKRKEERNCEAIREGQKKEAQDLRKKGYTLKEIAIELGINESTVKRRLRN